MPYISQAARDEMAEGRPPQTPGELNYALTAIVELYLHEKGLSYATLAEASSGLEMAKLELYRRVVAPYEDEKIAANGDVYTAIVTPD